MNSKDFEKLLEETDEKKIEILLDKELVEKKLDLKVYEICKIIKGIENQEYKIKLINLYKMTGFYRIDIINSFDNSTKINYILNDASLKKYDRIDILTSFDANILTDFIKEHKTFLDQKNILIYLISLKLDEEKQIKFVENLENMNLTLNEKKEILATLSDQTKQQINTTNFLEEYKIALSMKKSKKYIGRIDVDLERNLEDYKGLDRIIRVNPEEFSEEQKEKFMKLLDICPQIQVSSSMYHLEMFSTAEEYKRAEEWIDLVLGKIKPEHTKAQKVAIIDNAIGKKISYSPDFGTEIFDMDDCRALWKIIDTGYGVCNGISKVEQYIFRRAGIESEIVSSKRHSFLKIKDIELPISKGEIMKGETLIDPTWNLSRHRFNARPNNFCVSYETIRKNDVDNKGKDHKSHENDEDLQNITLELDEKNLRSLFASVGLADENGQFKIKELIDKSKLISEKNPNNSKRNLQEQIQLFEELYPDFHTCQNSTMAIIRETILKNVDFDRCIIDRVYDKSDKQKKPTMYIYISIQKNWEKKFSYLIKVKVNLTNWKKNNLKNNLNVMMRILRKIMELDHGE